MQEGKTKLVFALVVRIDRNRVKTLLEGLLLPTKLRSGSPFQVNNLYVKLVKIFVFFNIYISFGKFSGIQKD